MMLNLDIPSTCQIPGLEAIYYGVFGSRMTDRFFVEAGAYDGLTYSNTYGLAKAGWGGLYVEPVPHLAKQCRGNHKDHPGVIVAEFAAGNYDGHTAFYTDGQELFTMKKEFIEVPLEYRQIETRTLDSLLDFHSIEGIDLLVIDVEGAELDVLAGFDFRVHHPAMVIIEAHENHENAVYRENAPEINRILYGMGYVRVYSDHINNIYVNGYQMALEQWRYK